MNCDPVLDLKYTTISGKKEDIYNFVQSEFIPKGDGRLWKLHISANTSVASETLCHIAQCAKELKFAFKYIANNEDLVALNDGEYGLTQIGKFATIYPTSLTHLGQIVKDLSNSLPKTKTCRAIFDLQVSGHDNIFLRYGALYNTPYREPIGAIVPGWQGVNGEVLPDERHLTNFNCAREELMANGIEVLSRSNPPVISDRFISTDLLHQSPRGNLYLGIDIFDLKKVVVKEAHRLDRVNEKDGTSSTCRLKREHDVLQKIQGLKISPKPLAFEARQEDSFLVMEHIDGITLQTALQKQLLTCRKADAQFARYVYRDLSEKTEILRSAKIHHGDISPKNVLISDDGLKLIDFECALYTEELQKGLLAAGTPGFSADPEMVYNEREANDRSSYSLSRIFYYLYCGTEEVIYEDEPALSAKWLVNATKINDFDVKILSSAGSKKKRQSTNKVCHNLISDNVSIYDGLAGEIFSMHHLESHLLKNTERYSVGRLIDRVMETPRHPGFIVGTLGIAHVVRHIMNSPVHADELEDEALKIPNPSPDFLNGRAGQLRYFSIKYSQTGSAKALSIAKQLAENLCAEYCRSKGGWKIPNGYRDLSSKVLLGYAHGSSGIADCLLDYYRLSKDIECLKVIEHFEKYLSCKFEIENGKWIWNDGSEDGGGASWCHGAVGLARFYLTYSYVDWERAKTVTTAILNYLYENARWQGQCYCHGMAGTLDLILDASRFLKIRTALPLVDMSKISCEHTKSNCELSPNSLYTGSIGIDLIEAKQKRHLEFDLVRLI